MSRTIKISEVIAMIDSGQKRPEIKEAMGLTHKEMTLLFQHDKLKNRRAATQPISFIIEDDTETTNDEVPTLSLVNQEQVETFVGAESVEYSNGFTNPV